MDLRYDTRHARIFIFMRDTRIKKIMIRDTRHATREFVFLYARHENKKNYDTRHATRDTSVYLTMGHTVTSAIFRITKCLF